MFLSNWLILQIVAAGVTGAVEYPSAADFFMNFDSNNRLYFSGGSKGYASNLILYKGETEYPVYNGSVSNIYISDPASYVSYIQLCNETYVTNTVDVQTVVNPEGAFPDTETAVIPGYATSDSWSQGSMGSYMDFSGDGTRMVVGMGRYNSGQGRAAVYHLEDGTWVQKVDLASPNTSYERFGDSVLINEDGTRIAVTHDVFQSSKIHIYEYTNGTWPTSPTTSISTSTRSGKGDMDWNNDGTVIVTGDGILSGADKTYVYRLSGGTWTETNIGNAGNGVAINGAGTRILAGVVQASGTVPNATGIMYESNYDSGTNTWSILTAVATRYPTYNWPTRIRMDNDGTTAIAIDSEGGGGIYERQSGSSWTESLSVDSGIRCSFYSRGSGSISYDGTMVLLGDYRYDGTVTDQGRAYLYEYTGGSWSLTKTYENPKTTPVASDGWGYGTAITKLKDRIAIGMTGDDTAGTDYGSVYIYDLAYSYPRLTQDNYNKLSLTGLTPTTGRITFNSNTYTANGPVTSFYVSEAGTYEVSAGSTDEYAIVKKTVTAPIDTTGTPYALTYDGYNKLGVVKNTTDAIVISFHHGNFDDVYGDGSVTTAAANGHVYADTPLGTYSWGTLSANTLSSTNTTYSWTTESEIIVDYLVVAGGGGGGFGYAGGGGGAGGFVDGSVTVSTGTYSVVVGTGGAGSTSSNAKGGSGTNSSFNGIIGLGGGGAGSRDTSNAINGGSGGGGSRENGSAGSATQPSSSSGGYGNNGGTGAGGGAGGGGAGGAGADGGTEATVSVGGVGKISTITGNSLYYAAGGGGGTGSGVSDYAESASGIGGRGGSLSASGSLLNGQVHTGSGGGGGGSSVGGGSGGSGIVILKFPPIPPSSTLRYDETKTYDIGAAGTIFIQDPGRYEIATTNSETFLSLNSNVVGAVTQADAYDYSQAITTEQKLTASDAADGDRFGVSVAIDGDYAFVGARNGEVTTSNSGSVYVFIRNRTTGEWFYQQELTAGDAATGDSFGYWVSISGDYAIIGAHGDDDTGSGSGSAYIFKRDTTTGSWSQQTKLTASDAASGDSFGWGVAIFGDYAIVGARFKDGFGSAYIYTRSGTSWGSEQKLTSTDIATGDQFGTSVSLSGDYAIVGANGKNSNRGAAYIYKRNGTSWGSEQKITASDPHDGDSFGVSVSIDGDYAIIAAFNGDSSTVTDSGAAYIFKKEAFGRPTTNVIILSPAWGESGQHYHRNPSLDTTTSSFYELVVGTSWGSGTTTDNGHGIELRLNGTNTELHVNSDNNNFDPATVSIGGGTASSSVTLISGQTCTLYKADGTGYSFTVNSGHLFGESWSEQQKLTASVPVQYDYFSSASISGDYAIVGAYSGTGSAYLFKRSGTSWTQQAKLTASDAASGDQFGFASAIEGGVIFVGAKEKNSIRGAAYVYTAENLVPKLGYDGLNTLVLSNVSTGSYNTLLEGSNVLACGTDLTTYPVPKSGITGTFTYSARTKSDSVYAFTNDVSITDYYKLYQYPPIDGTASGITTSTVADTFNIWTISGAANGNGTYKAKWSVATVDGTPYNTFINNVGSANQVQTAQNPTYPIDITLELPSAKTIRKYRMFPLDHVNPNGTGTDATSGTSVDPTLPGNGGDDATKRPKSWILYGYDGNPENPGWVSLDTVTDKPISIYGDIYSIDTPGSYQQYKLSVTANNGGNKLLFGDIQMWGDA